MILDETVYLEHFGVKGMKWGVRNTDVSSGKQSKRDERAKKFELRSEAMQTKIRDLDALSSGTRGQRAAKGYLTRGQISRQRDDLEKKSEKALANAELKRQGKLSSGQRKLAIGAAAAAVTIAAVSSYNMTQSGEFNRIAAQGKMFVTGSDSPWKTNKNLADPNMDVDSIMSDVVSHINPNYGSPGTKVNCRRATFAYEMRRRGYDVAATKTTNGRGQDVSGFFNATNPDADMVRPGRGGLVTRMVKEGIAKEQGKPTPFLDVVEQVGGVGRNKIESSPGRGMEAGIFESLAKEPNGARGELGVTWKGGGGGHSVAWEIIGGKPVIFDTQSGRKMADVDEMIGVYGHHSVDTAGYTRLDNLPMNDNFLMRWVKDA